MRAAGSVNGTGRGVPVGRVGKIHLPRGCGLSHIPPPVPLDLALSIRQSRLSALQSRLGEALAGCDTPVTLEIGCGHGHFLAAYAAAHPEETCLAVDLVADRIERARRKTDRAGLGNVTWIHGEAALLLAALPAEVALGRIFILFSDPWPKRRHWKNRVIQLEFLSELAARAGEGAELYFRTDHADYFAWARRRLELHPCWMPDEAAAWPFESESVFQQRAEGSYQSLIARRIPGAVPAAGSLSEPEPSSAD